ncbi:SGNH/GDSL hydrolase family protein [Variovorax sp. PAMC 28711]|uniref:SGNH/GDSL hydrolase family protein n=1 Tax=Variovorax sp. PAMC 28711 TaxID=1795631 RepID=UPI00078EA3BF|nr:SGNH/GDSL hydrolase family protein [Variovorax sp. PAMC 28711]AMM25475.1 hypothetical protein AX767_14725 [Variovorax sp. PAMC 28711]
MRRLGRLAVAGGFALLFAAGVVAFNVGSDALPASALNRPVPADAIPLAVLGDSNSHSYQDSLAFKPGSEGRGGAFRARTFNWIEIIARLRGKELDPGPWGVWGHSGVIASAREALGASGDRAPRKEDYRYNFANSGAGCANLMAGRFQQAPRLLALMDTEADRWKRGVVVIRMGLNDWAGQLDVIAQDPAAPGVRDVTARCTRAIRETVALIHATHPETKVLVVGIVNEADDPGYVDRFGTARESANIDKALNDFNGSLRALAESSNNTAYFDDAAWVVARWGRRDAEGRPDYKTVAIGTTLQVANTAGDDPRNALVADHHAGLVWNALWAQSLVARLNNAFGLPLTPISDQQVADFVLPLAQQPPR